MRINEVIKKTELSKRTIYYYIDEKLITPEIDAHNGYNIFSNEDVEKLKIIQQLRKVDFSIHDICSILQYPNTTHLYLHKQIEQLEKELILLNKKIDCLTKFNNQLPIITSYSDLYENLKDIIFPDKNALSKMSNIDNDAKLVSIYLWGAFLQHVPITEYRQYLWEKVQKDIANSYDSNINILKTYLLSLSAEKLDEDFKKRYLHIKEIINITPKDYNYYVDNMKYKLIKLVNNSKYQIQWRNSYFSKTLPITCLFDSQVNQLISELSPYFSPYYNNINACCNLLYNWLYTKEGESLRLQLFDTLQGYINIELNHHGDLAALGFNSFIT